MAASIKRVDEERWNVKINQKAAELMRVKAGKRQLQVLRFATTKDGKWVDETCSATSQDIEDNSQLVRLRDETEDCSQMFVVRQPRSWETLNISRELFEALFQQWAIFPLFWRFIIPLGKKDGENEYEFPGFRARRTAHSNRELGDRHESAYILRRAELHNRKVVDGQPLYSIRQTAVYHSWTAASETTTAESLFLLVAPSKSIEACIEHHVDCGTTSQQDIAPWNFHRLLVADSLSGWMDYMAGLYEELRKLSDLIALAPIGDEKEGLSFSCLADFKVNFVTRQNLKLTEDCILDLQVILQTLLGTVIDVRAQCKKFRQSRHMSEEEEVDLELAIDEFDEDVKEVESLSKRAERLREKAASTTLLLADLLNYEDAVALKNLAHESHKESKSMHCLAEVSSRDSSAVKILTIITLFYLPSTIVANFFSTEFVHTTDDGKLHISADAWLLAAIGIPLTMLTLVIWWAWVYFMRSPAPPLAQILIQLRLLHQNTFGSFRTKKSSHGDLEKAGFAGGRTQTSYLRGWFANSNSKTPPSLGTPSSSTARVSKTW